MHVQTLQVTFQMETFQGTNVADQGQQESMQSSWVAFTDVCVENNISSRDKWRDWAKSNKKVMQDRSWPVEIQDYFHEGGFWPSRFSFRDLLARSGASAQGLAGSTQLRNHVTPRPPSGTQ